MARSSSLVQTCAGIHARRKAHFDFGLPTQLDRSDVHRVLFDPDTLQERAHSMAEALQHAHAGEFLEGWRRAEAR